MDRQIGERRAFECPAEAEIGGRPAAVAAARWKHPRRLRNLDTAAPQDLHRLRNQGDDVPSRFRVRDLPHPVIEPQIFPPHPDDVLASLAGEEGQQHEVLQRVMPRLVERLEQHGDFLGAEEPRP